MSHKNRPFQTLPALLAERDCLRAALEAIARDVRLAQAEDPNSRVAHRLDRARQIINQLVRDGLIACPTGVGKETYDPSPTGTFELVEDPEETEIILADLEFLARQQQR